MVLLQQILSSLPIAAVAVKILIMMSAVVLPCLEMVTPNTYLKLFISSELCLFMYIFALPLPLAMTLVTLVFISHAFICVTLLVRSCRSLAVRYRLQMVCCILKWRCDDPEGFLARYSQTKCCAVQAREDILHPSFIPFCVDWALVQQSCWCDSGQLLSSLYLGGWFACCFLFSCFVLSLLFLNWKHFGCREKSIWLLTKRSGDCQVSVLDSLWGWRVLVNMSRWLCANSRNLMTLDLVLPWQISPTIPI